MTKINKTNFVILGLAILILISTVVSRLTVPFKIDTNPCIITHLPKNGFGTIKYTGGLFSPQTPRYLIRAQGKLELTGDVCEGLIDVTEREYERLMYGHE